MTVIESLIKNQRELQKKELVCLFSITNKNLKSELPKTGSRNQVLVCRSPRKNARNEHRTIKLHLACLSAYMFTKSLFFILIKFPILPLINVSKAVLIVIRKIEQCLKFLVLFVLPSCSSAFDFLVFSSIFPCRGCFSWKHDTRQVFFLQTGWCWQNYLYYSLSHLLSI